MSNVISKCFVLTGSIGSLTYVEPVIFLTRPTELGSFEQAMGFENVFEARKFIRANVLGELHIVIAA